MLQSIARFQTRRLGHPVKAEQVVIAPGSKPLLFALFDILRGDVMLPRPSCTSIGQVPGRRMSRSRFIQSTAVLPRLAVRPISPPMLPSHRGTLSPGTFGLAPSEERPREQAGVQVTSDGDSGLPVDVWVEGGPLGFCIPQALLRRRTYGHTACMYLAAGREGLAAPACNVTLTSLGSLSSSRQVAGRRYMQPP